MSSQRLLGGSWSQESWDALGPFWAPLGHFLGVSCALLDASWLPNAAQEGPGLDFGGFREGPQMAFEASMLDFCGPARFRAHFSI